MTRLRTCAARDSPAVDTLTMPNTSSPAVTVAVLRASAENETADHRGAGPLSRHRATRIGARQLNDRNQLRSQPPARNAERGCRLLNSRAETQRSASSRVFPATLLQVRSSWTPR
ncbi:MAG TPA: hypothetical protein DEQ40_14585 [Oxalobacteraceae bacterium]|nr:hypothetical protein [Oxalobacteraceae bacterium]